VFLLISQFDLVPRDTEKSQFLGFCGVWGCSDYSGKCHTLSCTETKSEVKSEPYTHFRQSFHTYIFFFPDFICFLLSSQK